MGKVHTQVGEMILTSWSFPKNIVDASIHYEHQFKSGRPEIDLTDIVIILIAAPITPAHYQTGHSILLSRKSGLNPGMISINWMSWNLILIVHALCWECPQAFNDTLT